MLTGESATAGHPARDRANNRFEVPRGEVAESTAFAIQAVVAGAGRTEPVPPASRFPANSQDRLRTDSEGSARLSA